MTSSANPSLVENEIAADPLGQHFLSYIEPYELELISLFPHYYEAIRKNIVKSIKEVVAVGALAAGFAQAIQTFPLVFYLYVNCSSAPIDYRIDSLLVGQETLVQQIIPRL